jgi:hypothetical protein
LAANEVEWLINVHRNTMLSRQESVNEIMAGAFGDPSRFRAGSADCRACLEGILNEAGLE